MLKRHLSCLGILVINTMFLIFLSGTAYAQETKNYNYCKVVAIQVDKKEITVNDKKIMLNKAPYFKSRTIMVPIDFFKTALGAKVTRGAKKDLVTLSLKGHKVEFSVGKKVAKVNGKLLKLAAPAEIQGNIISAPLRVICNNLGANVVKEEDNTIGIYFIDKSSWKVFNEQKNGLTLRYPLDWQKPMQMEDSNIIKIISPRGSVVQLKQVDGKWKDVFNKIVDNHKGWNQLYDGRPDVNDPDYGIQLAYSRNHKDYYSAYIFEINDALFTLVFESSNYNFTDVKLADEIYMGLNPARKYVAKGNLLFNKDYIKAIQAYDKAIQLNPLDSNPYLLKSAALGWNDRNVEAIYYANKAIEIDPINADAYNILAMLNRNLEMYEESLNASNKALELNSTFASAYNHKGNALFYLNRLNEAIEAYNLCIELDPQLVEAYNSLGNVYYKLNDYDKALKLYKKALSIDNKHKSAIYNIAGTLFALGNYQEAIHYYNQYIKIDSKYADAYFGRSCAYAKLIRPRDAATDLEKAIQMEPRYREIAMNSEIFDGIKDYFSFIEVISK